MSFNDKITSKNVCELCGEKFSCGAKEGKCWCFEVEVAPEDLEKLKREFKNCLCRDCLAASTYRCELYPNNL
ncbi:MAG: cysteine-rich CWC family protein [Pyrinomonadaceae bacterium]